MYGLNKIILLNDINIIVAIIIVVMSIFIYSLTKYPIYISFVIVYSLEFMIFLKLKNTDLRNYFYMSLSIVFVVKMLCIIVNRNNLKLKPLDKLLLMSVYFIGLLLIEDHIISAVMINLFGNTIIFYKFIYRHLYNVIKKLSYIETKIINNEKYIENINKEISIENNKEIDLIKKDRQICDLYDVIISKINSPMIILKECSLVYKNDNFNDVFSKKNIQEFDLDRFFKNNFFYSKKIIDFANIDKSFAKIIVNSFKNQTYELSMARVDRNNQKLKIFVFRDITDMYSMEKQIKFNEKTYKKLIEVMEDGVVITEKNHISYMNKKVYDIFDINQQKCKVSSIEDLSNYIVNEDKEEFIKNIITDNFFNETKIWMIKTSSRKTLKVIENFLDYENKNFKLIIFSDVTKDQNLIEDIEEREKIYRVLLETLPDGIVIIDKNIKKHVYRNKYMINTFKKIGIEKFNDIVNNYIRQNEFDVVKIINLNNKENVSIAITDIEDQDIYIVIFKIIDKEQKIDDIKHKMQKIKKAEEFKAQFCMEVVNKIEKPVNDMLYDNKQMQKNIETPVMENHISLVRQNLYRLKKVLENIHDIMSIENYTYDLNYTVFDIVELMKNIIELSKDYIDKKDLNIESEFSQDEILVYLDSIKIQKVLLNILSNAIKFTDKGGNIKISIDKKMDFIVISIKDSGIGIPKEKIDFVFENFEQVDKSLSRLAEGMGMGLYLAKKLSDIQGIYLNVDSQINKGSEFKVLIRNTENPFLKNRYKENIDVEQEFVDIQFSDIYSA